MTENKVFKWIGILNLIIFACIVIFRLRENLAILAIVVLIPNLIAILVISWIDKKQKFMLFLPNSIKNILQINNITEKGFDLYKKKSKIAITWDNVKSVYFNKDRTKLTLRLKYKKIEIPNTAINWYLMIKKIPKHFKDFDFEYFENLFNSLTTCDICGSIAMDKHECLACGNINFDFNKDSEFKNPNDYIRQMQLDLFAIMDKGDTFAGFYESSEEFEIDKNWKPLITKKELIEYSKNEYWDD